MISPFEVYLVLQMDSIKSIFEAFSILSIGMFILISFLWAVSVGDKHPPQLKGLSKLAIILFGVSCVGSFIPSSKTLAAMIVVPALTSPEVVETVKTETSEIYEMAKQALAESLKSNKGETK